MNQPPSMPPTPDLDRPGVRRRTLLVGAAALGGIGVVGGAGLLRSRPASASVIGPQSPQVAATEMARARSGKTVTRALTAAPGTVDLAGKQVQALLYDGRMPGKEIRVSKGDLLNVALRNDIDETGSIHWHGLALRNNMDGVPDLTQAPIPARGQFDYSFVVPESGTFWFHPHSGLQLDKGLYAPLIVEDPAEAIADVEAVLVLDDWMLGSGRTPEGVYADLQKNGMGAMAMGGGAMSGMPSAAQPIGADGGDVPYALHLVNGRPPADPHVVTAKPGQRVRLRIINAAADAAYRVAIGAHRMTVTHADGFAVVPVEVDALVIGMGERYDVVVTAAAGVFPIAVLRESKDDPPARALLRTGPGTAPPVGARPKELGGRLLAYADLKPGPGTMLPDRRPDTTLRYTLGKQDPYTWTINDKVYADRVPERIRMGQRVRLEFTNASMMFHPMHLHGHSFALVGSGRRSGSIVPGPGLRSA